MIYFFIFVLLRDNYPVGERTHDNLLDYNKKIIVQSISKEKISFKLENYKNFFSKKIRKDKCKNTVFSNLNPNIRSEKICYYKLEKINKLDNVKIKNFIDKYGEKNLLLLKKDKFYYGKHFKKFKFKLLNKDYIQENRYKIYLSRNKKILFYEMNILIYNSVPLHSINTLKRLNKNQKHKILKKSLILNFLNMDKYMRLFFANKLCPNCHFHEKDISIFDKDTSYLLKDILYPDKILNRYKHFEFYYLNKKFESLENCFRIKNKFKILLKKNSNYILFFKWEKIFYNKDD